MAAIRAALSNDRFDLAVVAGGDGTVARVIATAAELLAAKEQVPPIALMPVGGLNNIACSLGIEGTIEDIVSGWRQGHPQPIDVGSAHGPWGQRCFVEAAGFGALTDGLSNIDASPDNPAEKKAIGRAAFREAMENARPVSVELWLDGERAERELLMLKILNLPRIGPRLEFAPAAGMADGRLDVLMIGPKDRTSMLEWLDGDCEARCPVSVSSASEIRVKGDFAQCRLDDPKRQYPSKGTTIVFRTMPRQATLLLSGSQSPRASAIVLDGSFCAARSFARSEGNFISEC